MPKYTGQVLDSVIVAKNYGDFIQSIITMCLVSLFRYAVIS